MNKKLLYSLLALVVVLLGLLAVFELDDRRDSGGAGEPFLEGFVENANDVNRVDLRFAGDEPGFSIRRDGDTWLVDARDNYPADFEKLASLVSSLANARIEERKTSDPDKYGQLGVDDPASGGSGIGITLSGEGFSYDVIVGKQAQRTYRYARIASDATSYLIDQDLDVHASPDEWLTDGIVDIGADRVRQVTIEHADGETIRIEKASRDDTNFTVVDIPDGRELSYESVGNGIAGALTNLSFDEVRKAQAADSSATASFETWDGLRIIATVVPEDAAAWLSFSAAAGSFEDGKERDVPLSEVDEINARLGNWQYRVADYKKNLFVRRWEDILSDKDDEG